MGSFLISPPGSPEASSAVARQEMKRFKNNNKLALQAMLGLPQNASAPLFSWVARPEPYQKGFYMVLANTIPFLKAHPNAQLILAGPQPGQGNAQIDAMLNQIQSDPQLAKRVSVMGFVDYEKVVRIHSGSDFLMHPSLYEPYGLSQLEAMMLGSLPIVNLVDGLKSTISDPEQNLRLQAGQTVPSEKETVWSYGQNGIAMEAFHPLKYWKGLNHFIKNEPGPRGSQTEMRRANSLFRDALERAYNATQDPDKMAQWRLNGLRYVRQNHDWNVITPRYEGPIQYAIGEATMRAQHAKTDAS